jgi:hypothetical protein
MHTNNLQRRVLTGKDLKELQDGEFTTVVAAPVGFELRDLDAAGVDADYCCSAPGLGGQEGLGEVKAAADVDLWLK